MITELIISWLMEKLLRNGVGWVPFNNGFKYIRTVVEAARVG